MNKEFLEEVLKALGNFMWLKNNMDNFYTRKFEGFLNAAMKDAEKVYLELSKLLKDGDNE